MATEVDETVVIVSCGSCGHQFGRMGGDGEKEAIDAHYRTCIEYLRGDGLRKERPLAYTYPPCRCGREIRKLNVASDDAKCVGCGYPEVLCRCAPDADLLAMRGLFDG